MKILQRLSWGGITSITERTTQARKAGEAALCSKRPVLRTGEGATQTARTTLRRIFENRFASDEGVCRTHSTDEGTDIHPNGASQLCDGFSRIDQLPTKEYAGRTRLMRERIYTQTARTTLRWIFENRSASDEGVCRAHLTDKETDIHPNGASQLCDGFSRIDQLPTKECAGRTRLMEERAICQQSGPFFRPRRSDHYNPPSTSI